MTVFDPHAIHPFLPNNLGFGGLDRDDHARGDDSIFSQLAQQKTTRYLPVWRSMNLFAPQATENAPPHLCWLDPTQIAAFAEYDPISIYLGRDRDNHAYIALDISACDEAKAARLTPGHFADLREASPLIDGDEGSILAYARALCFWHQRHGYCGVCGHQTILARAGHMRVCANPDCNAQHFPRTDAAMIVRVTYGDKILLGRQAIWPEGMMSTLAGFVEPGETLEHAVAREVYEEAGIIVKNVRYQHSQPWPFPASLMLGFSAEAVSDRLQINHHEIEHADWFTKADIQRFDEKGMFLPRKLSISRRLIEEWLNR